VRLRPTPQTCAVETQTSKVCGGTSNWPKEELLQGMRARLHLLQHNLVRYQDRLQLRSTFERLQLSSTFPVELSSARFLRMVFVCSQTSPRQTPLSRVGGTTHVVESSISVSGLLLHAANARHVTRPMAPRPPRPMAPRPPRARTAPDQYAGVQDPEIKLAHPPLPAALRALGTSSAS
jgi:hypothetical protein